MDVNSISKFLDECRAAEEKLKHAADEKDNQISAAQQEIELLKEKLKHAAEEKDNQISAAQQEIELLKVKEAEYKANDQKRQEKFDLIVEENKEQTKNSLEKEKKIMEMKELNAKQVEEMKVMQKTKQDLYRYCIKTSYEYKLLFFEHRDLVEEQSAAAEKYSNLAAEAEDRIASLIKAEKETSDYKELLLKAQAEIVDLKSQFAKGKSKSEKLRDSVSELLHVKEQQSANSTSVSADEYEKLIRKQSELEKKLSEMTKKVEELEKDADDRMNVLLKTEKERDDTMELLHAANKKNESMGQCLAKTQIQVTELKDQGQKMKEKLEYLMVKLALFNPMDTSDNEGDGMKGATDMPLDDLKDKCQTVLDAFKKQNAWLLRYGKALAKQGCLQKPDKTALAQFTSVTENISCAEVFWDLAHKVDAAPTDEIDISCASKNPMQASTSRDLEKDAKLLSSGNAVAEPFPVVHDHQGDNVVSFCHLSSCEHEPAFSWSKHNAAGSKSSSSTNPLPKIDISWEDKKVFVCMPLEAGSKWQSLSFNYDTAKHTNQNDSPDASVSQSTNTKKEDVLVRDQYISNCLPVQETDVPVRARSSSPIFKTSSPRASPATLRARPATPRARPATPRARPATPRARSASQRGKPLSPRVKSAPLRRNKKRKVCIKTPVRSSGVSEDLDEGELTIDLTPTKSENEQSNSPKERRSSRVGVDETQAVETASEVTCASTFKTDTKLNKGDDVDMGDKSLSPIRMKFIDHLERSEMVTMDSNLQNEITDALFDVLMKIRLGADLEFAVETTSTFLGSRSSTPMQRFLRDNDASCLLPLDEKCILDAYFKVAKILGCVALEKLLVIIQERIEKGIDELSMHALAALCRSYAAICQELDKLMSARKLCYRLLLLRDNFTSYYFAASMASVYPEMMHLDITEDHSKAMFKVVIYLFTYKPIGLDDNLWKQCINVMEKHCGLLFNETESPERILSEILSDIEHNSTEEPFSENETYHFVVAILLLAVQKGLLWTFSNLIDGKLCPYLVVNSMNIRKRCIGTLSLYRRLLIKLEEMYEGEDDKCDDLIKKTVTIINKRFFNK